MKKKLIRSKRNKKKRIKKESVNNLLNRLAALKILREITLEDLKQQIKGNIKLSNIMPNISKIPHPILGVAGGIAASEILNKLYGKIAKKPLPLIGKYPWLLHILGGAAGVAAAPHLPQALTNIAGKLNKFIGNIKRNQPTRM